MDALQQDTLMAFYRKLLYPRMIEEKMLHLLRQGKISKWFSGIGQEAISVGATLAMQQDEWILPMHRNLGVFTVRGVPLERLFRQWEGRQDGFSKGRERSFHFGSRLFHICGMISHLGAQLSVADGLALAAKLSKKDKAVLVFTGEGGTSEGEFHEALNLASVWHLPVIFLIENNGYGLSTPVSEQYACKQLSDRAAGYGMEGITIDGNNLMEVYDTVTVIREKVIEDQRPALVECMTFRMRGHEEASGTHYVPQHLFEEWAGKDPIICFEKILEKEIAFSDSQKNKIREELAATIETAIKTGQDGVAEKVSVNQELEDVHAPVVTPVLSNEAGNKPSEMRFINAISNALDLAMQRHDNLILMGQDIAEYGGAFKVTKDLVDKYGKHRVRNTPICESAVIGAALGLSIGGYKSVTEMQFADFISCGFNQVVNNLAKIHYRWGQPADVVIRMPTGGSVGAGPFHSQNNEAWFVHTPGLKVVYPATPADAKGMLLAAIEDPNPVLFFEHKALYRSLKGDVPDGYYCCPIGKANLVRQGEEAGIITYGLAVEWALSLADKHPEWSLAVLDLRSLLPIDYEALKATVMHTGKVLVLHEDTLTGGIGGEIAAWIAEHCFEYLDAPVMRCASLDTPVPFAKSLEQQFLALNRLEDKIKELLIY